MRQKTAYEFWRRYIDTVRSGSADEYAKNPAVLFTKAAKAGEYDALSDEEYDARLKDCEQMARFWHDLPQRQAGQVLLDALEHTRLTGEASHRLAQVLSICSAHTPYGPRETDAAPADGGQDARPVPAQDCLPQAVYERLNRRIRGQDEAKRAAAMVVFNHLNGRRSNALFCGPSGCGKTEIWRCLSRDWPGLIRIFDGSRLCADGWKGSLHLRDIFLDLPDSFAETGLIVVLDEADKLCCERAVGSNGTDYSALTQNGLLRMLDGDTIHFGVEDGKQSFSINCGKVSVVLLGAFENLLRDKSCADGSGLGFGAAPRQKRDYANTNISYDDLIGAGMRREIAGRINRIVSLRPLSVPDYRAILTGPVLDDMQAVRKCTIVLDSATADRLSERAAATGLGVRWMRSQVMNAVDELMFDDPLTDTYTVVIPPEQLAG